MVELPLAADPVGRRNPDSYATTAAFLEANGRLNHLIYSQQMRARHLFIRGMPPDKIKEETGLAISIIERLAFINEWEEERDKRVIAQFRRINKLYSQMPGQVNERHDRIAGTIETVGERMLQAHQDGKMELSTRDLHALTKVLETTREIRLSCRGKTQPKRVEAHITHELPQEMDRLAAALTDAVNGTPRSIPATNHTRQVLEVSIGEPIGTDEEFEGNS